MDTTVCTNIDEDTKDAAAAVLGKVGLSVSDAFRLMLLRIAADGELPFNLFVPNDKTIEAMEAARRGELAHADSVDELMAELNSDD